MDLITDNKRLEYRHIVEHEGETWVRKEYMSPQCFAWEDEPDRLRDSHTISWYPMDDEDTLYGYYSCSMGWSKDGHLHKDNPIPEIEVEFRKTNGKDLCYFNNIETPQ